MWQIVLQVRIEETHEDQRVRPSTASLHDLYAKTVRTGYSARHYHVSSLVYYNNGTYALLRLHDELLKRIFIFRVGQK